MACKRQKLSKIQSLFDSRGTSLPAQKMKRQNTSKKPRTHRWQKFRCFSERTPKILKTSIDSWIPSHTHAFFVVNRNHPWGTKLNIIKQYEPSLSF